jgi:membrane associated rhomboid family serine protease
VGSLTETQASQGGTAFFAHVGGFIAGIVLVNVMGARQRYTSRADLYWR